MHAFLSPDLTTVEQITNIKRPTDVPDSGCKDGYEFFLIDSLLLFSLLLTTVVTLTMLIYLNFTIREKEPHVAKAKKRKVDYEEPETLQ
ncbi:hypothetical protein Bca52824_024369 [Brassica carinata]|uniref:Uncharacterized protein n=1 Tax=Brassica carinata TaxID=52824 RepID=A0A8X7VK88_BRACI|nr:hypothetical protein Bca52824_024369 [Brassica carinata]